MMVTGDDLDEKHNVQKHLASKFEMKKFNDLNYFLGFEATRSRNGVFLSQRKYVLNLLTEIRMLGSKPMFTPIEQNHKLYHCFNETLVDKGRYQKLMEKLIYLSHTRPDIAYAINVVSQFMYDPRRSHMEAIERYKSI